MNNWNDKDFIPERMLERLRLGELSDEETQQLLDELEARGEMHRLEALIEEDEEIRSRYPPAVMASHARERLRRRQRENRDPASKSSSRPLIFAGFALALVAGLAIYLTIAPGPAVEPRAGAATPAKIPQADASTNVEPEPNDEPERDAWNGMLHDFISMAGTGNTVPVYACVQGEVHEIDDPTITRVTNDAADILEFSAEDEIIRLTCRSTGSAIANFHRGSDALPASVSVRSADPYTAEIPAPDCGLDGPAEVRALVGASGTAEKVLVAGRINEDATRCLRDHFENLEWEPTDKDSAVWRVAIWSTDIDAP